MRFPSRLRINELIGQPCLGDWSGLTADDEEWEKNSVADVQEDFEICDDMPGGGTMCWSGDYRDIRAEFRKKHNLD